MHGRKRKYCTRDCGEDYRNNLRGRQRKAKCSECGVQLRGCITATMCNGCRSETKKKMPSRLLHKRIEERRRIAERAGVAYLPGRENPFCRNVQKSLMAHAKKSWKKWLYEDAPQWWVARYWLAMGKPWRSRYLTAAEQFRIQYERDADYCMYQRAKSSGHRRRDKILSDGTVTARSVRELYASQPYCTYCGKELTRRECVMDHMEPRAKGGAHSIHNLTPSCVSCNAQKRDKPFDEWWSAINPGVPEPSRAIALKVL